jgi:septum formation inhibitor MinC
MDVYIYTEGVRKVKGEEQVYLAPLAELEDFESVDAALEALVDEAPDMLGTEFVIFTQQPEYITVEPPPETKYQFSRRSANGAVVEEEPEAEEDFTEEEVEAEEEVAPVATPVRKRPAKKAPAAKTAAKKRPATKAAAKQRPASKAGTRTGSSKRTPFTKNAASAD